MSRSPTQLRGLLADYREGFRQLRSQDFWRAMHHYWIEDLPRRMDDWTSAERERQGKSPDEKLERRRIERYR